ncbi:hypothetical protein Mzhil_0952 [Methanosalsum zhilinae DSM 4017]|uniref:Uncharacterized protein n=1 Tax=Methanosalsum zhilinae (strain DSM 4017 / NBRC 107636 / OCM 62 / WeN5) TaxID=679901 RepID=F7XLJ2_METZD|nr:hypothetical protein [Methanosalsum zhilinae]AEH60811.1 hypothetical protein Mzhil_0952 [Methanosalsum zhilinae DSM 4017]
MASNKNSYKDSGKCNLNNVDLDSAPLSSETKERIKEAREDLKSGNVCTLKQLKNELGLE